MPFRKPGLNSCVRPFLERLEDRLTPSDFNSLPTATVGQAYHGQLTVTKHAHDNYTFTVQGAPAWLHVSSSGKLMGVPDAVGVVEIQVKAKDDTNPSASITSFVRTAFDVEGPNPILTLTPNSLPAGTVGTPYKQSFSADAIVVFGENGPLPTGLSLSKEGTLSGTPTQAGTFNIIVTAYDSRADVTGSVAMPLVINPLITVSPSNDGLAPATENALYSQQFTASGGSGPYTYSYASSTTSLPKGLGLTLDSNGVLSGKPLETGTFPLTVMATDANGDTGAASYVLTVVTPITFTPPPLPGNNYAILPSGTLNQPYSQTIAVSNGSGSATLSYTTPKDFPPGLTIEESPDHTALTIQGTPAQAGREFALKVTAKDGNAKDTTTVTYYLTVNAPAVPIRIGPANLPNGTVGAEYNVQLTGSGGSSQYTYSSIASYKFSDSANGGLPPGLTLTSSGLLNGKPTTEGTYNFILQIADSTGHKDTAVEQVTIAPRPGTLYLTDTPLPLASPGIPYDQTITAQGGKGATVLSYKLSSGLRPGLQITLSPDKSTLTISGTPTQSWGPQTLTVTATDSNGDTAEQTYYLLTAHTPAQIAQAYGINNILLSGGIKGDGAGQTIAIIDENDAPNLVSSTDLNFANSDLARFDAYLGLPNPPSFLKLDQYGGTDYPSTLDAGSLETTMDVEWVHALAPMANLILVEYYPSSSHGIHNGETAIQTALSYPGVTAISYSIGGVEDSSVTNWSALPALNPNVTFIASSGDNGHHVISPSSAPNVLATGETLLTVSDPQGDYGSESAETDSGGGASQFVLQPPWQQQIDDPVSGTMRTTPDVAFNGDYNSGDAVYSSFLLGQGMPWSVGAGTSIATPSWAALIGIVNQGRAASGQGPLGSQTLPSLYRLAGTADFHDVSKITAGATMSPDYRKYNPWSGLGTPVANLLIPDLVGGQNIISGTVYDAGRRAGLSGVAVYLDAAGTEQLGPGDPTTVTDANGNYQFVVAPGTDYQVRIVPPAGYVQTTPTPAALSFPVGSTTVSGVNFGLILQVDPPSPPNVGPPSSPTPPLSVPTANEPLLFVLSEQWLNDIEAAYNQVQTLADQFWSNPLLFVEEWIDEIVATL